MTKEKIYVVTRCENNENQTPDVFTDKERALHHLYQTAMDEFIDRGYLDIARNDPTVCNDIARRCAGINLHNINSVMTDTKQVLLACSKCLTSLIEISKTETMVTIDIDEDTCVFELFETELKHNILK